MPDETAAAKKIEDLRMMIEARPGATDCQLSDSGLLIGIRW
jgi:hypothetical protein